jgi:hypothetical protein
VQTEESGHCQAQPVLHQQEREQGDQKAQQADAALAQQDKIGGQTDRGEEQQQEGGLCRRVEGDGEPRYLLRKERQHREDQTADVELTRFGGHLST